MAGGYDKAIKEPHVPRKHDRQTVDPGSAVDRCGSVTSDPSGASESSLAFHFAALCKQHDGEEVEKCEKKFNLSLDSYNQEQNETAKSEFTYCLLRCEGCRYISDGMFHKTDHRENMVCKKAIFLLGGDSNIPPRVCSMKQIVRKL